MAASLSPECTSLKAKYDSCFNSWFEGYLEPAVSFSSNKENDEKRRAYSQAKAQEFEKKCGSVWNVYRECVNKAVTDKGLNKLLEQARVDRPLKDPLPPPPPSSSSS